MYFIIGSIKLDFRRRFTSLFQRASGFLLNEQAMLPQVERFRDFQDLL